jgi:hypothetical protein
MNQASDEPLESSSTHELMTGTPPATAERPPTELQKAMQQRAQESLDRSRERARTKPAPLKWTVMFLLALVPVLILVAGIDAFVRVFHKINDAYSKLPVPAPEPQSPAVYEPVEQRPGIIILESPPPIANDASTSDAERPAAPKPQQAQ